MSKTAYKEIAKMEASKTKTYVVSDCSKGGYTIAQKMLMLDDQGIKNQVFLKGAFRMLNLNELKAFRDMVNDAIKSIEKSMEVEWNE